MQSRIKYLKELKYDKILMLTLGGIPLIDNINGILLNYKIDFISIGQLYRLFLVFSLILIIFKNDYYKYLKKNKFLLMGIAIIASISCGHIAFKGAASVGNLISLFKLLNTLVIIESIRYLYIIGKIKKNFIDEVLGIFTLTITATIIIPYILGVGFNVYSDGSGFKGFYYSNNELSIGLLVAYIFSVSKLFSEGSFKYKSLVPILIVCNFLVGSKTNMLGIVLVTLIFGIIYFNIIWSFVREHKKIAIVILGINVILIFLIKNHLIDAISRQIYYFKEFNILQYIFSSRNIYLEQGFSEYFQNGNIISNLLIGSGFEVMRNSWELGKLVELDFFDTIFGYGVIFTGYIYYYFIKIVSFKKILRLKSNYLIVAYVFIMGFSFVAGHIMYSGLGANILAIICAGILIEKDEEY